MPKIKYFGLGLAIFTVLISHQVKAQTLFNQTNNSIPPSANPNLTAPTDDQGSLLLTAIKTARATLQDRLNKAVKTTSSKIYVTSYSSPVNLTLALWQPQNNNLLYLEAIQTGKKIKLLTPTTYQIELTYDNGVNSQFKITGQPEAQLVGLIHPIYTSVGNKRYPKYLIHDVVYVPYHSYLNQPAVVAAGEAYFNDKITQVYQEISNLGIKSLAYPKEPLTKIIDPNVIKSVIAIEHVSATKLLGGDPNDYLAQFYVTLATNQSASYAYAKSDASARGLVQFIPATYKSLRKLRPELTLPVDFIQGMTDPYNAIKAQIGLMDYNLSRLPATVRVKYELNKKTTGALLAAVYNGGPTRLNKALRAWGDSWDIYHPRTGNSLKLETVNYLAKYDIIYDTFTRRPANQNWQLAFNP